MDQLIESVMTPHPYNIGIHERILEARRLMMTHNIHHLAVMNGDDLQGLITDRDIDLVLDTNLGNINSDIITVQDIMFEEPYIVDIGVSVVTVLDELAKHHIGTALITENDRLAGIFSTSDACRELSKRIKRESSPSPITNE